MASAVEIVELKSELRTIEELLNDLRRRKMALSTKLAHLEPAVTAHDPSQQQAALNSTPSYASAVKNVKMTLPLYESFEPSYGETSLALCNSFAVLATLPDSPPPPSVRNTSRVRKRASSPASSLSSPPSLLHKRPRLSQSNASPAQDKTLPAAVPQPNQNLLTSPAGAQFTSSGQMSMVRTSPITQTNSSKRAPVPTMENINALKHPPIKYILLGDSIIRGVAIPNGITYSYSGAKIQDLILHLPNIIDNHPTADTIIVHTGINDIKQRKSIQLRNDYELLSTTIESLGKVCVFSGILPVSSHQSEMFSRIYSANMWLNNFCLACGFGFIDHFDSFWKKKYQYRDHIHPNYKGLKVLESNIKNHIANIQP